MNKNHPDAIVAFTEKHYELAEKARMLKSVAGLSVDAPVGNNIQAFLDSHKIVLLEYPIGREAKDSFSAMFMRSKTGTMNFLFIGVNTNDYYDKQLFAIAHELYHFCEDDRVHIIRDDDLTNPVEKKAEYFAAELLLPLEVLQRTIVMEFGKKDISASPNLKLLRFIARLQCNWWLPYKAIVKRLLEAGAINSSVFEELYAVDERTPSQLYYRIGQSTNSQYFTLLNTITKKIGTSASNLENALLNYEDDIISESELIEGLQHFGVKPEDFGIEFISDLSDEEWDDFLMGGASNED
jgi:Zn-dependent peptidase ImmA (M78 family)